MAVSSLLKHLCLQSLFLFYGYSFSDRDLLATMDNMIETLGSEVGPHFWLTADDVPVEKTRYLLRHYSIFSIRVSSFAAAADLLSHVSRLGWQLPHGMSFGGNHRSHDTSAPLTPKPQSQAPATSYADCSRSVSRP